MRRSSALALRNIGRDIEKMRISSISLFEDEKGLGVNKIVLSYPMSGKMALVLSPSGRDDDKDVALRPYQSTDPEAPEETAGSYFGGDA